MIDLDIRLTLADRHRHFELDVQLQTDAPFTVLYGPSGSGKTSTLQAVAGLLRPDQGHIRIDGQTLFDARQRIHAPPPRRRIGYVFQHYALFPHLSVRANVGFGLTQWYRPRPTPAQRQRIDALLDSFGLLPFAHSLPGALSGGQQQRVALARALASEPRVLLLDEPFAALNAMLRADLRAELATRCRQWGIPVLMITHDIEDALQLADTVCVYDQGRITNMVDVATLASRPMLAHELGRPAPTDEPKQAQLRQLIG